MENHIKVSTHAPRQLLSRLGIYRLKLAARRRDFAIEEAHRRYAEDVRAITGVMDVDATRALRDGKSANLYPFPWRDASQADPAPALHNPFGFNYLWKDITGDLRALARRIRGG